MPGFGGISFITHPARTTAEVEHKRDTRNVSGIGHRVGEGLGGIVGGALGAEFFGAPQLGGAVGGYVGGLFGDFVEGEVNRPPETPSTSRGGIFAPELIRGGISGGTGIRVSTVTGDREKGFRPSVSVIPNVSRDPFGGTVRQPFNQPDPIRRPESQIDYDEIARRGLDLANLLNNSEFEMNGLMDGNFGGRGYIDDTIDKYPELGYLKDKLMAFYEEAKVKGLIPDINRDVEEAMKTYTGNLDVYVKDRTGNKSYIFKEGDNIWIKDEFGVEVEYPYYNKGFLPSWGFCGPQNKYFKVPNQRGRTPGYSGTTEYVNMACALHDLEFWKYGYNDYNTNVRFLARLKNLYPHVGFMEKQVAKIAIGYFSTIGNTIAILRGLLPKDLSSNEVAGKANDIFEKFYPNYRDSASARKRFYDAMKRGLDQGVQFQRILGHTPSQRGVSIRRSGMLEKVLRIPIMALSY